MRGAAFGELGGNNSRSQSRYDRCVISGLYNACHVPLPVTIIRFYLAIFVPIRLRLE
jgi:hypothetical protein